MSDERFYSPHVKPVPALVAKPGVRVCPRGGPRADILRVRVPWRVVWEAQFLEGGELFASRGGFLTRALAVQWADVERQAMEQER